MISRPAIVLGAAALLCASSIRGAATGTDSSRVLWQGPVFAGATVVWSEEGGGTGSLRQWTRQRGERVLYGSDSLALTRPLAASRTLLAFERTYPGCAPQPNVVCPQVEDALVGPLQGPFRTLVRPRKCSMPTLGNTVALDDGIAAYIDLDCDRQTLRVLVRDVGHGRKPLGVRDAAISGGCCRDVAIAGQFVAWSDRSEVVVYDRRARRVAYRARIGPGTGLDVDLGFDLQPDGKLAVAYRPVEFARAGPTTIAWLSPSAPRPHILALRGTNTRIRIAADRIAFERFLGPKASFRQPRRPRADGCTLRSAGEASERLRLRRAPHRLGLRPHHGDARRLSAAWTRTALRSPRERRHFHLAPRRGGRHATTNCAAAFRRHDREGCLVEAHGGEIWAENRAVGGARIAFTLPLVRRENG